MSDLKNRANQLKAINNFKLLVGVPLDDDHLNMVAITQEKGAFITPKNSTYLCIPTSKANGKKPFQIAGLYKRGKTLGIDDKSQPNGYKVMFVLRKSVRIPPRPFLRVTCDNHLDEWSELFADKVYQYLLGDITNIKAILNTLGEQMKKDLKQTIIDFKLPKNAELTQERKGFDNPLIDKKTLLNSIMFVIERK